MTEDEELADRRAYARDLIVFGNAKHVRIVRVVYVPCVPRYSIIGHAISEGSVSVWEQQGALVDHIETVERT